jgi:hypothetical protein
LTSFRPGRPFLSCSVGSWVNDGAAAIISPRWRRVQASASSRSAMNQSRLILSLSLSLSLSVLLFHILISSLGDFVSAPTIGRAGSFIKSPQKVERLLLFNHRRASL